VICMEELALVEPDGTLAEAQQRRSKIDLD
jgi:hypothetical protein